MIAVGREWDLREETRMKTVISEEERHLGGFLGRTVISKFGKKKQVEPVVLSYIPVLYSNGGIMRQNIDSEDVIGQFRVGDSVTYGRANEN